MLPLPGMPDGAQWPDLSDLSDAERSGYGEPSVAEISGLAARVDARLADEDAAAVPPAVVEDAETGRPAWAPDAAPPADNGAVVVQTPIIQVGDDDDAVDDPFLPADGFHSEIMPPASDASVQDRIPTQMVADLPVDDGEPIEVWAAGVAARAERVSGLLDHSLDQPTLIRTSDDAPAAPCDSDADLLADFAALAAEAAAAEQDDTAD
jgi:hypothetical protein